MNAIEIIQKWLKRHKYDGLVDPDIGCAGCSAKSLMTKCRFLTDGCKPAYRHTCQCGDVFYTTDKDLKKCPICVKDTYFDLD